MSDAKPIPSHFQLPKEGQKDEFFGFSRSFWLTCEKDGQINLRRTQRPGHRAFRVEIPYEDAKAMIESFQKTK